MKRILRALFAAAMVGFVGFAVAVPSAQADQGLIWSDSTRVIGANTLSVHAGANWYWSTCSAMLAECSQLARSEGRAITTKGAKGAAYSVKVSNDFVAYGVPQSVGLSPGVSFVKHSNGCHTDTHTGPGSLGRLELRYDGTNCSFKVWASDICKATVTATGGVRYSSTWYLKDASASKSFCG